ncbi:MAG: TRAP transporter small permease, partial [Cyclobacteriaceae bacterium]|nr:TRAP transporter small permease [Cyclobacteriaceae bacterium]
MKIKSFLDRCIRSFIAVLMALMVLNVTWQVVSRYVLGDPSSFTDELARYSMIWLGLLGAAYVSGKQGHLAIDVLVEKVKGKKLFYFQLFIHGMVIFFGAVIMVGGGANLVY